MTRRERAIKKEIIKLKKAKCDLIWYNYLTSESRYRLSRPRLTNKQFRKGEFRDLT
jgi:hypothetical protein